MIAKVLPLAIGAMVFFAAILSLVIWLYKRSEAKKKVEDGTKSTGDTKSPTPAPEPKKDAPKAESKKKTKGFLGVLLTGLKIIMVGFALFAAVMIVDWSQQFKEAHSGHYGTVSHEPSTVITLSTNWSAPIDGPFGYDIIFSMLTPDLGWDIKVNYSQTNIYERPPVNSPGYVDLDSSTLGKNVHVVQLRVSPTNTIQRTAHARYVIK
jgi:hypothetical protein